MTFNLTHNDTKLYYSTQTDSNRIKGNIKIPRTRNLSLGAGAIDARLTLFRDLLQITVWEVRGGEFISISISGRCRNDCPDRNFTRFIFLVRAGHFAGARCTGESYKVALRSPRRIYHHRRPAATREPQISATANKNAGKVEHANIFRRTRAIPKSFAHRTVGGGGGRGGGRQELLEDGKTTDMYMHG